MSQPWKHFQKAMSWMIGQAAWVWAKTGILESDDTEAYGYVSDDESAIHGDYHENEEKFPPVLEKDERSNFDQNVRINRTRPEVCDQEVNFNLSYIYIYILFYSLYYSTINYKIIDYNYNLY